MPSTPLEQLMTALHFTEQDLEMNKNGAVSDSQKKHLGEKFEKNQKTMIKIMGAVGVIMAIGIVSQYEEMGPVFKENPLLLPGIIIGTILLYAGIYHYSKQKTAQIMKGTITIKSVEGPVKISIMEASGAKIKAIEGISQTSLQAYCIEVQGTKMYTNEPEVYEAFEDKKPYRIYCFKMMGQDMMLSAEPL